MARKLPRVASTAPVVDVEEPSLGDVEEATAPPEDFPDADALPGYKPPERLAPAESDAGAAAPPARPHHTRCRVVTPGWVRSDGFKLDGDRRDTWHGGEVGDFPDADVLSLEGILVPLS